MRWPIPGSPAERARFAEIQRRLAPMYVRLFQSADEPRAVVVVPSLSLDADVLAKITGAHHYEERMLCLLMLLRMPHTRVIYLTSHPIDPTIIDYYLHLLPGVPHYHARRRLTLLSCRDDSSGPLTQKLINRPRLLARIRAAAGDPESAHITCFNATALERTLAVRLGLPLYACDPELLPLGSKSGSRTIFREAGIGLPDGFEHLRDTGDVVEALADLKRRHPDLARAVVKWNEGFSGEGNAVFSYEGCPPRHGIDNWVRDHIPAHLTFEGGGQWETYRHKLREMGGIVESFVAGESARSPSVQCRIDPLGRCEVISTHEQLLGGLSQQVFLGCSFPADTTYRPELRAIGDRVGTVLAGHGVIGRFGVDFLTVKQGDTWRHHAIEINLRKGGTTHPFQMLQFLTDGAYDPAAGVFRTRTGQVRCYLASDNLHDERYRGLTPHDLVDIAVEHGLHFDAATQEGVVFHLIGALYEFGKLGIVSIGATFERARALYDSACGVLDAEAARGATASRTSRS